MILSTSFSVQFVDLEYSSIFKQTNAGGCQKPLQTGLQGFIDFFFIMFFTHCLQTISNYLSSQKVLLSLQFFFSDQILCCNMLCKQLSIEISRAVKCGGPNSALRCADRPNKHPKFFLMFFILNTHPFSSKSHKQKKGFITPKTISAQLRGC